MTTTALRQPSVVKSLASLLREPELVLWIVFLVLVPFYVVKSGLPQPADYLSLVILPVLGRRGLPKIPQTLWPAVIMLFVFAAYAATVNILWGFLLIDHTIKKVGAIGFASFYFFNAYVFASCVYLYLVHGARMLVATAWGTIGAVILQVLLLALMGGSGGFREKLFFNNPNQLGYYALLAASLIAFGFRHGRVPAWMAGCALAATTLLASISLSKAAIIGTIAVAAVAAVRKPVLLIVALGVILLGAQFIDPTLLVDKVSFRLAELGSQGDDTLSGRGYSRIEMHPEYLVLGAGEVGHDRHGDFGGELHSSWATVLFSYGIVGLLLLWTFLWRTLRLVRRADLLFLVPTFWYGLTHQGLRFRLFWVFLAFVFVAAHHQRTLTAETRARPRKPSPRGAPVGRRSPLHGAPMERLS